MYLDGGGIRGYSSLLILQRIMKRIAQIETTQMDDVHHSSADYPWGELSGARANNNQSEQDRFRPCHYFDYIAGTSTGGLSAIMLGRLRMSVSQALANYERFGNDVFGKARLWHGTSPFWYPRPKYSTTKTETTIKAMITEQLGLEPWDAKEELFMTNEDQTRWCARGLDIPRLGDHRGADMSRIYEVARATSAAPSYFDPIEIKGSVHFDGAIRANNPSCKVITEVWYKENYRVPALFLSIGTGKYIRVDDGKNTDRPGAFQSLVKTDHRYKLGRRQTITSLFNMATDLVKQMTNAEEAVEPWKVLCEDVHRRGRQGNPIGRIEPWWHRLNVKNTRRAIAMDEWIPRKSRRDQKGGDETLQHITSITNEYLDREGVRDEINRIASALVEKRRARVKTEHWERFALKVSYPYHPDDHQHPQQFDTREELRTYLERQHRSNIPLSPRAMHEELNKSRQVLRWY
ncbi:hypothetical protein PG993_011066 [Apiospora rasikravindrae]|uniref:PNPLA domain-containing protein n=1 Tax=Apiospora rasikravindrae TaxID=990691 RepID=A0ABR1SED1_9PEZI